MSGIHTYMDAIALDEQGSCYFTGSYSGNMQIDSISMNNNCGNVFVMKMDSLGRILWFTQSDCTSGSIQTRDIILNERNEVFIIGATEDNHTFGSTALTDGMLLAKIGTENVIGIDEIVQGSNWMVYPNPSSGVFNLMYMNQSEKLQLNIRNILGQIVYSETASSNGISGTIDLSNENKGLYFIEVIADEKREVKKVVLQ